MARLRRSDSNGPGIERRRRGGGFSYRYGGGKPVRDPEVLDRIRGLAVPPAWTDVWICPWPNGHIQAIGTDAAGRRQYRYHDDWRVQRDREKFERTLAFADRLPKLRRTVARDLRSEGVTERRVLAAIVRLLDVGCFRIGGEEYADEHETFGVSSLRQEHVTVHGGTMSFDYPAKGSIERRIVVHDKDAAAVVSALHRRRAGGPNLFAYRQGRTWHDVHADHVNAYIKAAAGDDYSAKDFRTWSGTLLAAVALAGAKDVGGSATARNKAVAAAVATVAHQLGNTPAVSRSSYIDPRIVDRFLGGDTIANYLGHVPGSGTLSRAGVRRSIEEAVVELIEPGVSSSPPAAAARAA